jgi:hypothetical protein
MWSVQFVCISIVRTHCSAISWRAGGGAIVGVVTEFCTGWYIIVVHVGVLFFVYGCSWGRKQGSIVVRGLGSCGNAWKGVSAACTTIGFECNIFNNCP